MSVMRCRHMLFLGWALLSAGCMGEKGALKSDLSPETVIGGLTVSPPNVILAVGGTQQLGMTAVSLTGVPLTAFDSVVYAFNTPSDTQRVKTGPQGLLTGVAPSTTSVLLNVFAFQSGGVKADQVVVQVTASAVPGATLSIQPPDSAKWAVGVARTITPVIRNPTTGVSVVNPALKYTVKPADQTRLRVYTPLLAVPGPGATKVTVQSPPSPAATTNQILPLTGGGTAWVYAAVGAYGTLLQDSVLYTLTNPYTLTIIDGKCNLEFCSSVGRNQTIALAPGATVTFTSSVSATDPLTVTFTFDAPAVATVATPPSSFGGTTGNITTLTGGQSATRRFLTPGTYHWTAVAAGAPAPWNGQTITGALLIQ